VSGTPITRREALAQSAAFLAVAYTGSVRGEPVQSSTALAERAMGWPQANGPDGNFNPRRYGHGLVDDLADARLLWASAETDLGFAKGSVSGYLGLLIKYHPSHPGSCAGPIVADGKVFATSFRPAGDVWAENTPQLRNVKKPFTPEEQQTLRGQLRIEADDLLLAVDQKTGRTLWKAVEPGRGVNRYMGKREGFGVAPAYHAGRVFSMGATGRLYAYDADTGKRLWEGDIGPAHREMEARRQTALTEKRLVDSFGWDASLVVAGGVLIVPLFDHSVDMGLRGVDVQTGNTRWELPAVNSRYATPVLWRHEGREYVLVANRKGELRLIDPTFGRVLWTQGGLQPVYHALSPSESHVLVNVGSKSRSDKRDQPRGLMAAYRLSLGGAERTWTMPDRAEFWFENHMDSCAMRRVLIRDGFVYFSAHNKADDRRNTALSIFEEASGELLLTSTDLQNSSLCYLVEDRLLHYADASHRDRATLELFTADPAGFRRLCAPWKPPQGTTTGYEVFLETPYVDGCLFMRSDAGDIRCYDLRKA
jgi:outer membrane protein assembly factor BamB